MPNATEQKVAAQLKDTYRAVDSGQLLKDLMDRWGGTERFARDLVGEYREAKQGSLVRQKVLEMVQKLVVTNTVHQINQAERPEDLDTADIDARLQSLIARVVGRVEANEHAQPTESSPPWNIEEEPPFDW
jgi:hypothetical protein